MDEIRYTRGRYMQVPINEKTVTTELSGDFTLPDYQPEIKRLLKVSAEVLPPQKYVGDSEGEISGGIDYYVLYTGIRVCKSAVSLVKLKIAYLNARNRKNLGLIPYHASFKLIFANLQ